MGEKYLLAKHLKKGYYLDYTKIDHSQLWPEEVHDSFSLRQSRNIKAE